MTPRFGDNVFSETGGDNGSGGSGGDWAGEGVACCDCLCLM